MSARPLPRFTARAARHIQWHIRHAASKKYPRSWVLSGVRGTSKHVFWNPAICKHTRRSAGLFCYDGIACLGVRPIETLQRLSNTNYDRHYDGSKRQQQDTAILLLWSGSVVQWQRGRPITTAMSTNAQESSCQRLSDVARKRRSVWVVLYTDP